MWAHSHLIRAGGVGYSQIIRAENADVCRSYGLCLQAAICNNHFVAQVFVDGDCQVAAKLEQVKELAIKLETALAMFLMREQLVVPMLNTESV